MFADRDNVKEYKGMPLLCPGIHSGRYMGMRENLSGVNYTGTQ